VLFALVWHFEECISEGKLRNPDVLKFFTTLWGGFQAEHSRSVPGLEAVEALAMLFMLHQRAEMSRTAAGSKRRSPSMSGMVVCLPRGSTPKCRGLVWGWKSQKSKKNPRNSSRGVGEGKPTAILHLCSPPFECEPTLIHKWLWQPKALGMKRNQAAGEVGSKGSKKTPKANGEGQPERTVPLFRCSLLCRGECGTAELAGGRRGVAELQQGSGAITFFFFCFK